ncbi:conserved hypothetical protein [Parvibaculum lavamentivorans DS-1]|uniref:DUF4345 domain-containing protein n=1 Tax=Parvibaculum lavamentivorans (strain DS-1 / DSM 13023 / NCIMB 13966) TaxID=402881 RepID=A7HTV9_PARL1|nr:hypothetical protein [Parvibaculum lavamentivorans]ABS63342.1 conserved hypothetical protein [Parvibaculum lavamentivorans DS-1]
MTTITIPASGFSSLKKAALALWALVWLGNALWMLADPQGWYAGVDGVANTGPYNPHFVRDIGMAYLTLALLAFAAIRWPAQAVPLVGAGALFLGLHAILHVWDIAAGRLPAEHILMDMPGVFLPVAVSIFLAWWCAPARAA